MLKAISPKEFLKKAREKGSINCNHIIIKKEIKKTPEDYTLKRYKHIIVIWG